METKRFNRYAVLLTSLGLALAAPPSNAADEQPRVGLKPFADGFASPLNLVPLDDGSERLLLGDQVGVIHVLTKDGKRVGPPFLDVRSRLAKMRTTFDERGLLGVALHPDFRNNRKLYVYYSAPMRNGAPAGWDHTSHVSEFKTRPDDFAQVDPASERVLLHVDQPQDNHNCGRMAFGPDGFLYIGTGDGGAGNDTGPGHSPQGNGQDTTTLLGKMLRIDVNKGNPFAVPTDNPFADGAKGRPEIFAYGLRNPWGMSFDRGGKHELFVSDVGQSMFEEINIVVRGGNYGWRIREGFHGFDPKRPNRSPEDAPKVGALGEPLLDPILEYKNMAGFRNDPEAYGTSVTGGCVYRGKAIPQLEGRYIFGDWSQSWAMPRGFLLVASPPAAGSPRWSVAPLKLASHPQGAIGEFLSAFGQDGAGELYALTNGTNAPSGTSGKVFKLVPM